MIEMMDELGGAFWHTLNITNKKREELAYVLQLNNKIEITLICV